MHDVNLRNFNVIILLCILYEFWIILDVDFLKKIEM